MSRVLKRLTIQRMAWLGLFLLGCTCVGFAQHVSYNAYIENAEYAYDRKDYFNAFKFYEKALQFNHKDSLVNLDRAAESAFRIWQLKNAEHFLKRLIDGISDPCDSLRMKAWYHLGLTYQRIGNYEEAKDSLNKALGACPSTSYQKKMYDLVESLTWAMNQKDSTGFVNVSDFRNNDYEHYLAPAYYEDKVVYTRQFFNPGQKPIKFIHQVGQIRLAHSSGDIVWRDTFNGVSEDLTIGFPTFNDLCTRIYYASCEAKNTLDQRCRILTRTINGDSIGESMVVIEHDTFSFTHPHLVETSSGSGLFFVSDHHGGKGGLDIWYAPLLANETEVGTPINLEGINSQADEVSPFYDLSTHSLFFSSDRLDDCKSFGGMDIYRAISHSDNMNKFREIRILPTPINSMKNDIFFVKRGARTALFSSNRQDATITDPLANACCYNLYETDVPLCQIYFYPYIIDYCSSDTLNPIDDNIDVKLHQVQEKRKWETVEKAIDFDSTRARFPVERGTAYMLTLAKNGYQKDTFSVYVGPSEFLNTYHGDDCRKFCTFPLQSDSSRLSIAPSYRCFPSGFPQPLENCTLILRNSSDTLTKQKVVRELDVMVAAQDTYYLTITHPDFTTYHDTVIFSYQQRDSCYKKIYPVINREISLYFENDVPRPMANLSESAAKYAETWIDYTAEDKEKEYKQRYSVDTAAVEAFFARARKEYETYDSLKAWIERKLKNRPSSKVVLLLEGRASPIASDPYNWVLSQRRIHSIERDLQEDDRLKDFFNPERITFRRIPGALGEERSKTLGISDDKDNLTESVYNPRAARQRRITIRIIPASCLPRIDH